LTSASAALRTLDDTSYTISTIFAMKYMDVQFSRTFDVAVLLEAGSAVAPHTDGYLMLGITTGGRLTLQFADGVGASSATGVLRTINPVRNGDITRSDPLRVLGNQLYFLSLSYSSRVVTIVLDELVDDGSAQVGIATSNGRSFVAEVDVSGVHAATKQGMWKFGRVIASNQRGNLNVTALTSPTLDDIRLYAAAHAP
jgi:hypothetical protein